MQRIDIGDITCFGTMNMYQNVDVVCDNGMDDYIYPDGFDSWQDAVNTLTKAHEKHGLSKIVQLQAV